METKDILTVLMCESDNSSSEDEEIDMILLDMQQKNSAMENKLLRIVCQQKRRKTRNCITSYIDKVIPKYTEEEFKCHFRIKKELFIALSRKFGKSGEYLALREDKRVSAEKHMLVFLWFAGHEAVSFRDIGDRFDLSISSVSVIVERVIMFISNLAPQTIKWPDDDEKKENSEHFEHLGFPNVIGAIDGTHIIIDPPFRSKDSYVNRKGQISIQAQAIANSNKKIINFFAGFPGSAHDSRVFKNSTIYPKLSEKCGDYFMLGDSAYPLMENLLTPYRDNGHLSERQKNFNRKLSSSRVVIEHTFGILKQRFRQLYYCKLRGIQKLNHFIRACCVLHNLCDENDLEFEDPPPPEDPPASEYGSMFLERSSNARANIRRDEIAVLLHN